MDSDFYSIQVYLPKRLQQILDSLRNCIIDKDNITQKLEDDYHVTIIYGLNYPTVYDIQRCLKKYGKNCIKFKLSEINIFSPSESHDESDVAHIQIKSQDLEKLHSIIKENLDNEETFPTYKPHITLAFVKPNSCNKIRGLRPFNNIVVNVHRIILSDPNWRHIKIPLL